jgi:sulfur transfer complex TusBCD TusB component (DsrH family)
MLTTLPWMTVWAAEMDIRARKIMKMIERYFFCILYSKRLRLKIPHLQSTGIVFSLTN